jgi:hypothetical protein
MPGSLPLESHVWKITKPKYTKKKERKETDKLSGFVQWMCQL